MRGKEAGGSWEYPGALKGAASPALVRCFLYVSGARSFVRTLRGSIRARMGFLLADGDLGKVVVLGRLGLNPPLAFSSSKQDGGASPCSPSFPGLRASVRPAPLFSLTQVPHGVQTQIQDWLQDCDRPGLALLPWSYWGRLPGTPHRPRSQPTTPGTRASDSLGAAGPGSQAFSLQQRGPAPPW